MTTSSNGNGGAGHGGAGNEGQSAAMDRMYRFQRHIYDLTRKYYLLGRDHLIADLDVPEGGTVLELGCGTGRNIIAAAKAYPTARFTGVDISHEMLKSAQSSIDRAGLGDRVMLAQGDASAARTQALAGLPASFHPAEGYDRVFISYALSMIPPWEAVIREGLSLVRPGGGRLSVVDFGACEGLPGFAKATLYGWLDRFHVTPREDLTRAMEAAAAEAGTTAQVRSLTRGYALYGTVTRP